MPLMNNHMKKTIAILVLFAAFAISAKAQTFGVLRGKNNAGTYTDVKVAGDRLKTADSALAALIAGNLKLDSSYTRIGVKVLQLPTVSIDSSTTRIGVKVLSGNITATLDSSTQRVGVKLIQNPTITNDSSTLSRKYIKISAVEGTVATSLDSNSQRSTIKISSMPSVTATTTAYVTDAYSDYADLSSQPLNLDTLGRLKVSDIESNYLISNIADATASLDYRTLGIENVIKDYAGDTTNIHSFVMGGVATNSTVSYVNGTANPLSLDYRGYLRTTLDTTYGQKTSMKVSELPVAMNTGAISSTTQRVAIAEDQAKDVTVTGAATNAVGNNIILASAGSGSYDTYQTGTKFRSVNIQVVGSGTISSATVVLEESNDNSNWTGIPYYYLTSGGSSSATMGNSGIGLSTGANIKFSCQLTARYMRFRISAWSGAGTVTATSIFSPVVNTLCRGVQVANTVSTMISSMSPSTTNFVIGKTTAVNGTEYVGKIGAVRADTLVSNTSNGSWWNTYVDKTGSLIVKDQRQHRRTYNAAFSVVAASSATDIVEFIGSSSKTILIHKITISGTQTTGGQVPVYIIKRSTAASGGTSTNPTYVPRSTILAEGTAATASIKVYTANPTTGTAVGNVWVGGIYTPGTSGDSQPYDITFNQTGAPILLSGTSQTLCINLDGRTYSGNTFYITFEWSETGE